MRNLKLAIVAAALSSDVRQAVRTGRTGGVDGLLFEARSSALDFAELSGTGQREFRHLLEEQQRQMVGLRLDLGPKGFAPSADIDQALAAIEKAMKAAADLRAPLVCLDLGPLPAAPAAKAPKRKIAPEEAGLIIIPTMAAAPAPEVTSRPTPADIDPNFVASVDAALAELGTRADRYGCVVAMRSELAPFSALERAMLKAACPWFGVDLDPVDVLRDEWSASEVFDRLGVFVRHVRARDAVKGTGQRTQPAIVGQGSSNWAELSQLLDDAGYHGWITLDPVEIPDRAAAMTQGLKLLRLL